MTIRRLYQKAFVGGQWHVGLKNKGEEKYRLVDTPKDTWIADPFLYEANGEHYLFVELYEIKRNKACLGYYSIVDGEPFFQDKIIDRPYHLSYPCVFEYDGKHYLIPESSANKTVDLYVADEFPKKWDKEKTLISGRKYVDTTVLKRNGRVYLTTYRHDKHTWTLDIFLLDMEAFNLELVKSKSYSSNIGRPAGNFITDADLIRPAQNCASKYGESIILYQVDRFENGAYEEHEKARIEVIDLPMDAKADRIHTVSQDSMYECVDVYFEKGDLLHGVKTLWRAYLRKYLTKE